MLLTSLFCQFWVFAAVLNHSCKVNKRTTADISGPAGLNSSLPIKKHRCAQCSGVTSWWAQGRGGSLHDGHRAAGSLHRSSHLFITVNDYCTLHFKKSSKLNFLLLTRPQWNRETSLTVIVQGYCYSEQKKPYIKTEQSAVLWVIKPAQETESAILYCTVTKHSSQKIF